MSTEDEKNPYELLNLGIEASDQEIKTAYRKLSLKVHPDRNPNNPDAAQKFHELNQAYELLLDPLRRLALTSSVRAKEARKARFSKYDKKRRDLQDELEERERAFKKQKMDKASDERARAQENERIMEQGRKMREERIEAVRKQADQDAKTATVGTSEDEDEVPPLGNLDTTVKVKYSLSSHPSLTSADSLAALLEQFGSIDSESTVLSLKPPKKAPTKPPKSGVALVPFRQIGDAFASVCASGRSDRGLDGIEISWAEGREPPILGWLKKQGKLDTRKAQSEPEKGAKGNTSPQNRRSASLFAKTSTSPGASTFSSFPESFPIASEPSSEAKSVPPTTGLDYESLTLMRLRQAERERLEREIREQEAIEGT